MPIDPNKPISHFDIEAFGVSHAGRGRYRLSEGVGPYRVEGLQICPLACATEEVAGAQIGVGTLAHDMGGAQLALRASAGAIKGLQASLGSTADSVNGLQLSVLGSGSPKVSGMQVSGLIGRADLLRGTQFAGAWAHSETGVGIQAAAFVQSFIEHAGVQLGGMNRAAKLSGAQVGVINAAKKLEGVQIGLVNLVPPSPDRVCLSDTLGGITVALNYCASREK